MRRAVLAEEAHIVNIAPPIDINGSGKSSDVFSMAESEHVSIIVQMGVTGAAATLTVEECDDFTPTNSTAIAFNVYKEEAAAGDTLGSRTAVTSAGLTTSTNDNIFYVIEIDACELTDGYDNLRIVIDDPEAATLYSAVAILSGNRYAPAGTQIA